MARNRNESSAPTCVEHSVDERIVLLTLVAGTFIAPLDSSIVNIALPAIAADFGARIAAAGWVATAYVLTTASLVLTMGRLSDILGLRRIYVTGFLVFGAGSAACALAPSIGWLIAARVFQAVGAAAMFAAGPALVTRTFAPRRRGWALGWISLSVSAGLTLGPAVGGLLVGSFGWQAVFLINIPLALSMALLARRLLPEDCTQSEPFDLAGAVLAAVTLTSLLLALSEVDRSGLTSPNVLGALGVAIAAGFAFVSVERAQAHPMLDLSIFAERGLSAGVIAAVCSYASLFAVTFTMPFYLLRVRGIDAQLAGLILTATPISMAIFSPLAGRLSDRWGSRALSTAGLAWLALSLAGATQLSVDTPPGFVALTLFSVGTGISLFQAPNTAAILRAVPPGRAGVGSALVGQARNLGMAVGIGVTAAIVSVNLRGEDIMAIPGALTREQAQLFVAAMRPALLAGSAFALAGAVSSWARGRDAFEDEPVDAGAHPRVDSPGEETGR
ncbi:MAG: MFS transporter [Anaerosomatales bacterium]|nr:MFS transporter [Anaerosomatales bacterium]MDT8433735.1 MFS transporter [Anaerosomatales bacterium]